MNIISRILSVLVHLVSGQVLERDLGLCVSEVVSGEREPTESGTVHEANRGESMTWV